MTRVGIVFSSSWTTSNHVMTIVDISVTTSAPRAHSARASRTSARAERRRVDHPAIPSIAARSWTLDPAPPSPRPGPIVVLTRPNRC
jgi:hypothetical protein